LYYMGVVSARVDEDTRRRLSRLSYINWCEVIRRGIKETLEEEEGKRSVDPEALRRAARITDELRKETPGWDSTREIRRWREPV